MLPEPCFANVIVDFGSDAVRNRLFTYRIPQIIAQDVLPGVSVLIPFGQNRSIPGYVISISDHLPDNFAAEKIQIKEILAVLDSQQLFDQKYIDFLQWIANYYLSNLMDVLAASLPACLAPRLKQTISLKTDYLSPSTTLNDKGHESAVIEQLQQSKTSQLSLPILKQRWRKQTNGKEHQFYRSLHSLTKMGIIERGSELSTTSKAKTINLISWSGQEPVSDKEKQIVDLLQKNSAQLSLPALVKEGKLARTTIARLVNSGFLIQQLEDQTRDPLQYLHDHPSSPQKALELTTDQQHAFSVLSQSLSDQLQKQTAINLNQHSPQIPWLLHGVTGSGKTEIYLRLIDQALKHNRSALLLVPEIALTPQLAQRLVARFGKQIAVWHSGLSIGERYDTWKRLQTGELKILLGARSAILVNMPKLGLIILDEEHDSSYKQTSPSPRYNAKTVALEKASRTQALILFGSATPDVATYYQAEKEKQILSLPARVYQQNFPESIFVDMREEFAAGNRSIFSRSLATALKSCVTDKQQAIVLINRRGYANHVFCRGCGYVSLCKNCSAAMVYHKNSTPNNGRLIELLICHHCGYQCQAGRICPSCQGPFLKHYGLGTQKAEIDLQELIPEAKILRLDSDTVKKKGAHEHIFQQFSSGKADILIGTQMVAKGLDNERVTLVGILAADAAFNLPDYRSTERGFQLLTQVAGRAGRGYLPGKVILQTFNPDFAALKLSQSHDYAGFYATELAARETFLYPPFSQLIRVVIASKQMELTQIIGEQINEALSNFISDIIPASAITILGPAPCLLEKLHGNYRQHLIIKNLAQQQGQELIASFLKTDIFPKACRSLWT